MDKSLANSQSRKPKKGAKQKKKKGVETRKKRKIREATIDASAQQPTSKDETPSQKKKPFKRKKSDESFNPPRPSSRKRNRSDASSPSKASKKPKRINCEAVPSHLKVAIIDKRNLLGKISAEQERLIKNELLGEMDKIVLSSSASEPPPEFRSWNYRGKIITIVCEDDRALDWLRRTIGIIKPWNGAELDIISHEELLKTRLTKATVWIPVDEDRPLEEMILVVSRLAGYNPNLEIRSWSVFHYQAKTNPRGHLLVFGIGEKDLQTLRERGMRVFYQFNHLSVRVKTGKSDSNTTVEAEQVVTRPPTPPNGNQEPGGRIFLRPPSWLYHSPLPK